VRGGDVTVGGDGVVAVVVDGDAEEAESLGRSPSHLG
jgi:hypothetical protein